MHHSLSCCILIQWVWHSFRVTVLAMLIYHNEPMKIQVIMSVNSFVLVVLDCPYIYILHCNSDNTHSFLTPVVTLNQFTALTVTPHLILPKTCSLSQTFSCSTKTLDDSVAYHRSVLSKIFHF